MSRIMLKICKYAKISILVDLLRSMHTMAKKTHSIGDSLACRGPITELLSKPTINMSIYK